MTSRVYVTTCVVITADMKRQWYRVKIKLDEINDAKSKMAGISTCNKNQSISE